jgi:hypothetical protein
MLGMVIDPWICSLSTTGIMLVFYMAACTRSLSNYFYETIKLKQLEETAGRVETLLDGWCHDEPNDNPTIRQCVTLISSINESLQVLFYVIVV